MFLLTLKRKKTEAADSKRRTVYKGPWHRNGATSPTALCLQERQAGCLAAPTVGCAALHLGGVRGGAAKGSQPVFLLGQTFFTLRTSSLSIQGHPWAFHLSRSFLRPRPLPRQGVGWGEPLGRADTVPSPVSPEILVHIPGGW